MFFVTHMLAGAALAAHAPGPAAALAGGLASHALLDGVPHHDYRRTVLGVLDFILGVALVVGLSAIRGPSLWWGALGAGLPDLEVALFRLGLIRSRKVFPLFPSHRGLTPHPQVAWLPGVLTQVVAAALSAWLLIS